MKRPVLRHHQPLGLALVLLAAVLVLSGRALHGQFLSDDIAIMHWLLGWEQERGLWHSVLGQFGAGLPVPSHYYRPLAFVLYALDYRLYDWQPFGWHLSNLLIHLGNAALVGLIARVLAADALRAVLAAGLFALFPLAPEVSIWLSGRYDALALTGMLVAVYGHLRALGWDRWRLLSLAGFAFGLAAKESAMTTPGLLLIASFLLGADGYSPWPRLRRALAACWPALLLFACYLLLRTALFGSMLQVYPDSQPGRLLSLGELGARLWALGQIPRAAFAEAPVAGGAALLVVWFGLVAAAWLAWRRRDGLPRLLLPLAFTLLSLLALVPHLEGVMSSGEGGRFYYATAAWLALLLAGAIDLVRPRLLLALALCAGFASAQRVMLDAWAEAGGAMRQLLPELARAASTLGPDQIGLLLVPDALGPVPFARNAQGGISVPPQQPEDYLTRLLPFVAADLGQWPVLLDRGLVAGLKHDPKAAPRLDAVFCFDADRGRIVRADTVPDWHDPAAFRRDWREFLSASGCRRGYAELLTP